MYRTAPAPRWPLERVLFALAGSVTLVSVALVALVSPWFLALTAFVGVNQWLYVVVGACPASLILKRAFGFALSSIRLNETAYPRAAPVADDSGRPDRQARSLHRDSLPRRPDRLGARRS